MKKPKLFIFGIDSASWRLIDKWAGQGKLPNFKRILDKGSHADLMSTIPPLTPCAWSSFYTGLNPGKHGVFDFYKLNKDKTPDLYSAEDRKGDAFWKVLDEAGMKCAIYNMPLTFPVDYLENGVLISGFTTPSKDSQFCSDADIQEEFKQKFPKYVFSEEVRYTEDAESKEKFFQSLVDLTKSNIEVTDWLFEKNDWDLFGINFMAVDHVQHWYWKYMDKDFPEYDEKEAKLHGDKIYKIYKQLDDYLGELDKRLEKKGFNLLVYSDHGVGPHYKNVQLNNLFRKNGVLFLKNSPITIIKKLLNKFGITPHNLIRLSVKLKFGKKRSAKTNAAGRNKFIQKLIYTYDDIDWDKTKAVSFGYYGNIIFNKQAIKNKEDRKELTKKIKKLLKNLKDPDTNEKIVNNIWLKKEVYSGSSLKQAPDILFSMKDYSYASSMSFAFASNEVFSETLTFKSGEHNPKGMLALFGPEVKNIPERKRLEMVDLFPTILDFFGVKYGEVDGKSFSKEFFKLDNLDSSSVSNKRSSSDELFDDLDL